MFLYKNLFKTIFLCSLIILITNSVFGQNNLINKICAETNDKLQVKVWVAKSNILSGEDIIVYFEIKNNGNKEIFLVNKSKPEIFVDRGRILIEAPLPFPLEKSEYDYSFVKILPQNNYKGQINIPNDQIKDEDEFAILTAFGFVLNIEGINRELKLGEDPVGLRNLLNMKMKTIGLGEIEIHITKTPLK